LNRRRALIAFSGLFLATRRASAAGDLLSRIAGARAQVHTLQGPFTQTRRIGLLVSDVRSSGDLALTRPNWLRWRLSPPDDVTFWVGPEGLSYRSAHGQGRLPSTGAGIAPALDDLCTLIGGDLTKLYGRWSLRVVRDGASGVEVEASARDGAPAVRTMTFGLTPDLTRPTRMLLVQGAHDWTDIQFGQLRVNEAIDDAGMVPP
jgi:hypothetical protein